jgi:peptide/nickel transport system substrate-binding protein
LVKGWQVNPDNTITTYFDYNFPASPGRVAFQGAPSLSVATGRPSIMAAWEILEALTQMVAEGSASGTAYSFTFGDATAVDVLRPSCVADIRAKLKTLKAERHVPAAIQEYVTADEAVAGYEAAIGWIDEHGHAMISCGPFYIETYDPTTNYMELRAFRDPAYPFTPDYWPQALATTMLRIDSVDAPVMYATAEQTMPVRAYLSEVRYPEGTAVPAEQGAVSVVLVTPDAEREYQAEYREPGVFEAAIPVESLEPGSYTILINAELTGALPVTASGTTVLY